MFMEKNKRESLPTTNFSSFFFEIYSGNPEIKNNSSLLCNLRTLGSWIRRIEIYPYALSIYRLLLQARWKMFSYVVDLMIIERRADCHWSFHPYWIPNIKMRNRYIDTQWLVKMTVFVYQEIQKISAAFN